MRYRLQTVGVVVLCCGVTGCSGNSTQTVPTAPVVASDITGTWTQVGGEGTRTWSIAQGAIQVSGPATFSQDNNPNFGPVSGHGGVVGAVFGGFMFAETYEGVSGTPFPSPQYDCYIDTNGQLTVSGNTMTGSVTESDGCNGVRLGQFTRPLTMQRT
jgi:hypothetical protein